MTTKWALTRDVNGYNGFGLQPTDKKFAANLAQLVQQSLTVPADSEYMIAIFSYDPGLRCYVAYDQAATVPGGVMGATSSELLPVARRVKANTVINFITPDVNCNVTVLFYALNENYV